MSEYNVESMVVTTICQKCPAKSTKTPLVDFKLSNGLLSVPEIMYCPGCGNYATIQTRSMTKEELGEREKKGKEKVKDDRTCDEIIADALPPLPFDDGAGKIVLKGSDGSVIEGEKSEGGVRGDRADAGREALDAAIQDMSGGVSDSITQES